MEDLWLSRAKRLMALARTGQGFAGDAFDRERYDEIAEIATAMMADLGGVPLSRIRDLVPPYAASYATPSLDVRGALIEEGRILLVQEQSDGRWALPGGFADIGLSAGENIVKEVQEEAGLQVRAERLYEVTHKARHPYPPDPREFYAMRFLLARDNDATPVAGSEATDARFFAPDALPPLSETRTIAQDIARAFAAARAPGGAVYFD
ncbi:MAG: NUDIX hydrolase [Marinibacterium sp.]|nr:NUDIX hydrolase [Marinibacterium sp.]